jgi:lysophospholipase L1-like esterase
MVTSCCYGVAMTRFDLFPVQVLGNVWRRVTNTPPPVDWYQVLRKRYEDMPASADYVMFGDSHTSLIDWRELLPSARIINRGIPGDTVNLMLSRIGPILKAKPKKVFLMAGTNDLAAGRDPAAVAKDYEVLINLLTQAGIQPVVQSTLMTAHSGLNSKISALNSLLALACNGSNCQYLDLNRSIAPSGILQHTVDGVHLDVAGYMIWRDAIARELR